MTYGWWPGSRAGSVAAVRLTARSVRWQHQTGRRRPRGLLPTRHFLYNFRLSSLPLRHLCLWSTNFASEPLCRTTAPPAWQTASSRRRPDGSRQLGEAGDGARPVRCCDAPVEEEAADEYTAGFACLLSHFLLALRAFRISQQLHLRSYTAACHTSVLEGQRSVASSPASSRHTSSISGRQNQHHHPLTEGHYLH